MIADSPTQTAKPAAGAGLVLVILAVAQVIPIGLALLVNFGDIQDQVVRALDRHREPLGEAGALVIVSGATFAAAIAFVAAVALAVLASRADTARVAARVVSGLLLLWSVVVTVINPVGGALTLLAPAADTNNTLSGKEFQEQLNDALPGWIPPTLIGFAALTVVLVIAFNVILTRTSRPAT